MTPTLHARGDFVKYHYQPSMAAAVVFIVLFAIASVLHLFRLIRTRTWFMIPFLVGCVFETIGYAGRAASAAQNPGPYSLGPYIVQEVLILVAPALFAASIYMELGRISIMLNGEDRLLIRRSWLTKIFVAGDVLSFLMQAAGAGIMSSGKGTDSTTGQNVVVAGLFVQVIFFGLFVVASVLFHTRIHARPTGAAMQTPWHKHMIALYVVSILIFVRSIVRVVEFIQGYNGYIMGHEVYLYVFDGAVMFIAVSIMLVVHPAEVARIIRQRGMSKEADPEAVRMADVSP